MTKQSPLQGIQQLVFETVGPLKNAVNDQQDDLTVDLANISECDSGGLALLLHWKTTLVNAGHDLHLANPPRQLLDMAKMTNTEQLLGIE